MWVGSTEFPTPTILFSYSHKELKNFKMVMLKHKGSKNYVKVLRVSTNLAFRLIQIIKSIPLLKYSSLAITYLKL